MSQQKLSLGMSKTQNSTSSTDFFLAFVKDLHIYFDLIMPRSVTQSQTFTQHSLLPQLA